MPLAERDRLSENIVARAEEVNIENLVVLDETEDSLIVVTSALGAEGDDDALGGMRLNYSTCDREREQVVLICEELERGGQVAVIDDIEETVSCRLVLHLTELDSLGGKWDVIAICHTLAAEFNLIAAESRHFKKRETGCACNQRRVCDSYFYDLARADFSLCVINLDGRVFSIVIHLLYRVRCGDVWRVLEVEDLACSLADKQILKIEALSIKCHEWVLADCTQFDHFS